MSKYLDPKWLTFIATIVITAINKYFNLEVDIAKVVAALIVIINFLIAQFSEDIKRIKAGQAPRSSILGIKTLTMAIACIFLGVANYYDWPLNEQELIGIVGFSMFIITGKSLKDGAAAKKEGKQYANGGHEELDYRTENNA